MAALAISSEIELTDFPFMRLAVGQSLSHTHIERTMKANGSLHSYRDPARDLRLPPSGIPLSTQTPQKHHVEDQMQVGRRAMEDDRHQQDR